MISKVKLAILGGFGPYASSYFTNLFLYRFADKCQAVLDYEFPEFILYNVAYKYIDEKGNLISNDKELRAIINNIMNLGFTHLVCPCVSISIKLRDIMVQFSSLRHIDIVNITNAYVEKYVSRQRILVFSSSSTANHKIFTSDIVEYEYPSKEVQQVIDEAILCVMRNQISDTIMNNLTEIISENHEKKIIVACSELPIILREISFEKRNVIDAFDLTIDHIINLYKHRGSSLR